MKGSDMDIISQCVADVTAYYDFINHTAEADNIVLMCTQYIQSVLEGTQNA